MSWRDCLEVRNTRPDQEPIAADFKKNSFVVRPAHAWSAGSPAGKLLWPKCVRPVGLWCAGIACTEGCLTAHA